MQVFEGLTHNVMGVVGAGPVGAALVRGLRSAGIQVRLWNRTVERSEALRSDGVQVVAELAQVAVGTDAVLFAVAEDTLGQLAKRLCLEVEALPDDAANPCSRIALHTSGSRGPEALAALQAGGWATGQMHPAAAVSATAEPTIAPGTWWGISGAAPATDLATHLVPALGGHCLRLAHGSANAYHLAANLVAGGAVALVDLGLSALGAAADQTEGRRALAALLASVARNLDSASAAEVLTGPQARGAVDVVEAHLELTGALGPELDQVYRMLAQRMVALARGRGDGEPGRLDAIERLLDRP
ncbi:MAG: putative short-subunit dehydrogenase-like oxidoreductase (DUF2520 family) [Planctomycetota bacterium]|jgi:predicted short-subunit dehydrogenase-like oxidoreductase (DUF2520 family)